MQVLKIYQALPTNMQENIGLTQADSIVGRRLYGKSNSIFKIGGTFETV